MSAKKINLREPRLLKAVNDVMKNYIIEPVESDNKNEAIFHVSRKPPAKRKVAKDPYIVTIFKDWSANPTCTCPDATSRPDLNGYCKHTIGTMMKHDEYKCQLMEIFMLEENDGQK